MGERAQPIRPEPAELPESALTPGQDSNQAISSVSIPNVPRLRPLPRDLPARPVPNVRLHGGLMVMEVDSQGRKGMPRALNILGSQGFGAGGQQRRRDNAP